MDNDENDAAITAPGWPSQSEVEELLLEFAGDQAKDEARLCGLDCEIEGNHMTPFLEDNLNDDKLKVRISRGGPNGSNDRSLLRAPWKARMKDRRVVAKTRRPGKPSAVSRRQKSLETLTKDATTPAGALEIVFECSWTLPFMLREAQRPEISTWIDGRPVVDDEDVFKFLSNYTVLQGDGNAFIYSTTEDYLKNTWGEAGLAALRLLVSAVGRIFFFDGNTAQKADESNFPFETLTDLGWNIHFRLHPKQSERQDQLESALRWLCGVVRRPTPSRPATPMIEGQPHGYHNFLWSTVPERSHMPDGKLLYGLSRWTSVPCQSGLPNPSCWTDLFARGVIIESSITRTWGQGLETSFSLMVTLGGVENMYQIDGGIILLGFFTALVPISRDEKTDNIQWHLETSDTGINPRQLECTRGDWFRTTDIDMLKKARCFIGWFEQAHVMLGTRQLATDEARKLRWTGLESRKQTMRQFGHEIGVQGGFSLGPISTVAQGVSVFANHSNELRYSAPRQFLSALTRDRQEVALVIDAESRRAWLVPLVSWILHLCHRYYIQQCGHGDTPIPFAEPSTDGAEATVCAVKDRGGTVVFGAGTEDEETLRQLWLRISTNLGESQPGREDPQRGLIFAAEAMDIMLSRDSYLKELPTSDVSASWAEFAKLARTTTVCANLGNAIVPVPPSGKLCECCTLLESQDFLAAHTWSLARLLELKGRDFSQLGKEGLPFENGASWKVCNGLQGLWTNCPAGEECRNIWSSNASLSPILQRLDRVDRQKSKGKGVEEEPPIYDRQAAESGVVVFGGYPEPMVRVTMPGLIKTFHARFGSLELFAPRGVTGN